MPCAAPCDWIPCDERCDKILPCGHQCPGLCGEICPIQFCHTCGQKDEVRVDLLEMKSYAEIDVDETPVVLLNCGHLFTAETLDGLVGLTDVYETDKHGVITGLKDLSHELAVKIPQCPDCQSLIMQYATQRYNRVVNRAVMDEVLKRFIVYGQTELRNLDEKISALEKKLESTVNSFTKDVLSDEDEEDEDEHQPRRCILVESIKPWYEQVEKLIKEIRQLEKDFAQQRQPNKMLHDAIV
ncbi:unnamed protein product [Periconia digitata]|uniref:NFX1-type zinc finger-containing protein 1 n=1 Tax=Periconia digitata TaxID=1303443 RepID=A0A9W4UI96_9PLEO|nr:unnamed protein product [Periconia digitata]